MHWVEEAGGDWDAVNCDIRGDFLLLTEAAALLRVNRVEIFAGDKIQVCHLVNRCVRRTYLCGQDEEPGRDYSHRKQWIRDRLEMLAGIFR